MEVRDFSFSYPSDAGEDIKILKNINLDIPDGGFYVLCGHSGCGKTTLLRCMKEQIAPEGRRTGRITSMKPSECGFVFQNPERQIVTDTVRHELAFGLENMGLDTEIIRQRVAETALFFGIDEWIDRSVYEISGGEKQLLNLAAVIAMRPKLLLLDEPAAQLDPTAKKNFLELLLRVNRELGIAVLLSEHNLEEVLPVADKILYMEAGQIVYEGTSEEFCCYAGEKRISYEKALPAAVRLYHACPPEKSGGKMPLTVRAGIKWALERKEILRSLKGEEKKEEAPDICLRAENLWFQYKKNSRFVLKKSDITIRKGEIHMILGGNGSGKTTLLSVLSKRCYPQRGRIRLGRDKKMPRTGLLPQNPKAMFSRDTVQEELQDVYKDQEVLRETVEWLKLVKVMSLHPYDLSGGEQQRLGLALVLAGKPELLLLDEPTKGLDPFLKEELGEFLRQYAAKGNAVVCVTHDVEFAADCGEQISLLFEGEVLTTRPADEFLAENAFFTTDTVRILRNILPGAVRCENVKFV